MGYRADWQLSFRAGSRDDAAGFMQQVLEEFPEHADIVSLDRSPDRDAGWMSYFVTPSWDVSGAEAIRKALVLGRSLGYQWHLPSPAELASPDELICATMYSGVPQCNAKYSRLEYATFRVVEDTVAIICPGPVRECAVTGAMSYSIELVNPSDNIDERELDDAAITAIVCFENGSRWKARFIAYRHLEALRSRYTETGECDGGRFIAVENMILVPRVDRETIEETVRYLLDCGVGVFGEMFRWIGDNQSYTRVL